MIIGYIIECKGCKPMRIQGENFNECYYKYKKYWDNDYDVDTDILISAQPIEIEDFDIV